MEKPTVTEKCKAAIETALQNPELAPVVKAVLEEVENDRSQTHHFISKWKQAHDELIRRGYDLGGT
jgi:hypothetical protein